jgi:putative transposase
LIEQIDLLRHVFTKSKKLYNYELFAIVIMPDHLHMIIKPNIPEEYSKIVSYIKRKFSNIYYQNRNNREYKLSESRREKRESDIWQRRFYEHTIRNDKELHLYLNYIHYNPVKHQLVDLPNQWDHSSFSKFVKLKWYEIHWSDFNDDYDFE